MVFEFQSMVTFFYAHGKCIMGMTGCSMKQTRHRDWIRRNQGQMQPPKKMSPVTYFLHFGPTCTISKSPKIVPLGVVYGRTHKHVGGIL
jgi:hypothetical protein